MHATLTILVLSTAATAAEAPSFVPADPEAPEEAVHEVEVPDDDPATSSPRVPASVTIIPVDATWAASADVADVVGSAAGTTVQRLGGLGDYAAVSIRGSTLRQVQIYLDGVPLNPDGASVVNLSELPASALVEARVYRGNAPPEYAAAPLGGVVDLLTHREPPPATVGVSAGQLGTSRAHGLVGGRGALGSWSADGLLLVEAFHTDGDYTWFDDNGTAYNLLDDALRPRENNATSQLVAHGRVRAHRGPWRFTALEGWLDRDEGLPGQAGSAATQATLATRRNLGVLEGRASLKRWDLLARAHSQLRAETLDDRENEVGLGTQHRQDVTHGAGLLLHSSWLAGPRLVPSLTATGRHERYVTQDLLDPTSEEPARTRRALTGALAADLFLWGDRLQLAPVLQGQVLDSRGLGDTPYAAVTGEDLVLGVDDEVRTALSPRVGTLLRPLPWLDLRANAGHYQRPPDLTELFGDRGALVGNPELRPETGWQWDCGLRIDVHRARRFDVAGDVAAFWNASEDRITYVQNGQRTSVPVNVGRAWVQGVEGALTADLGGVVQSRSAVTWTLSRNLTPQAEVANKQLPGLPAWEVEQHTSAHWRERLRVGHSLTWLAGNYWDATNWYATPPRALHGAFLRASPGPGWPSVELSGLNLLNRIVAPLDRNPLDDDPDDLGLAPITDLVGYPLPGRTWLLTVKWQPKETP